MNKPHKNHYPILMAGLLLPFIFSGCLKTSAEIQRDQEMEQALVSARESSSLVADLTAKNKDLQDQMSSLQGRVDELQLLVSGKDGVGVTGSSTSNKNQQTEQFLKLAADVEELKLKNSTLQTTLDENTEKLKKLENSLKGITTTTIDANSFHQKDNNQHGDLNIEDIEKMLSDKKYNDVLNACKDLLNSKVSDGKKNRCKFAQGLAYKELKQFDDGLLSLSQIYTDWPKSSLAPNALLEIGKILQLKGQKKDAQLMFKKLINEYPKSEAAKEAKKISA